MKTLTKLLISLLIVLVLAILIVTMIIHSSTKELVSPARRQLQDYHAEWLETPTQQGIRIDKATLPNSNVPYLVINPDGKPARRGRLLRKQLAERNVSLPAFGKVTGQLIILHGRSGRKEDVLAVAERYCAIGLRCMIPDLPAHGENPTAIMGFGTAEGEDQLVTNLHNHAIDTQLMTDSLPTSILGMSMGGAYAVKTAQQDPRWKSISILCSFDSLESIIDSQSKKRTGPLAPIFSSLVKRRAESLTGLSIKDIAPKTWAKEIHIPVLIAHGKKDDLISIESGKNLYHSFASKQKKWLEVPDAHHSDILVTKTQVFAPIGEWICIHHAGS